ncbi:MAG: cytochrome c biogenesis protein ResB [Bacteroidales bacterium]|nr:cytochrome c biogenesis protein ResB [Bacteroidales bacterium]
MNTFFKKPFGYKEAFLFSFIFPVIGFFSEILSESNGILIPKAPYNIHIILGIIILIVFTHLFLVKLYFFKWLSTAPIAIANICCTAFLVLLMAIIPQLQNNPSGLVKILGLSHMSKNWALILSGFFLLYTLGLVILRRFQKFNVKNIVFFLNHAGLWIIIAVAGLGSGDLSRLSIYVWENSQPEWRAGDGKNSYELPIAIKLIDFEIDEFNPELALVENATGNVIIDEDNKIQMIENGGIYYLHEFKIIVEDFYELAMRIDTNYIEFYDVGATPAAKIAVYDKYDNLIVRDWISAENYMMSPKLVWASNKYSIGLLPPEPKKFSSKVELFAQDGTKKEAVIEVNKPVNFKGWKIYQLSYDESKGRWSEVSVLELVRDPWIPVVYVGVFMVLFGAIYLFWIGKKSKE